MEIYESKKTKQAIGDRRTSYSDSTMTFIPTTTIMTNSFKHFHRRYPDWRGFKHDFGIYIKRILYAISGKEYIPLCCFSWSLDYRIMRYLNIWLCDFIPKHQKYHVCGKNEIKRLNELHLLVKKYINSEWDYITDEEFDRLFFLLKKEFRRLRL